LNLCDGELCSAILKDFDSVLCPIASEVIPRQLYRSQMITILGQNLKLVDTVSVSKVALRVVSQNSIVIQVFLALQPLLASLQNRAYVEISSSFGACRSIVSAELTMSPILLSSISIQTSAVVASTMQSVWFIFSKWVPTESM